MNYRTNSLHRGNLVLNYKFWIITALLLLVYSSLLFSQTSVYFNPSNSGDPNEDGSLSHPYDNISDITLSSNTDYYFKRGTTMIVSSGKELQSVNNLSFKPYGGSGERPILEISTSSKFWQLNGCNNVLLDSLHFIGYSNTYLGNHIINIGTNSSNPTSTGIVISNCEIERGHAAIVGMSFHGTTVDDLTITNCEIHDIGNDAIFIGNTIDLTVQDSHIYDVNMNWYNVGHTQNESGGDGIQIGSSVTNFKIYNNIIDRRSTGNKFCFIYGGLNNQQVTGEIIGNTFYPPKDTVDDDGGMAIYLAIGPTSVLVARNKFIGRGYDGISKALGLIHGAADTIRFIYNTIDSIGSGYFSGVSGNKYTEFMNNTAVNPITCGSIINFSGVPNGIVRNNLMAGYGTYGNPMTFTNSPGVTQGHNIQVNSTNTSLYNSTLGITNWETSDFRRTSDLNDGIDVGLDYDLDSIPVGLLPERGSCEYNDGSQVNSPPSINNQTFGMEENTEIGEEVGIVVASDPDQGQTLTYSIVSGNLGNTFQINSGTGALTVNNSETMDFETNPLFSLTIEVLDNGIGTLADQAEILIDLINVNELDQPATWMDNNSTEWNIANNWNTDLVPDENTIVNIPGGLQNYPVLKSGEINIGFIGNGNYNCRTISINNGGKIELLQNNIININSDGTIVINTGGELINNGTINVNSEGELHIKGGTISCSYNGNGSGNVIFCSGSNGYMNGGIITVNRSIQFLAGTNWMVNSGTLCCGGTSDEVQIIVRSEGVILDNLIINEGVRALFVSDLYPYPLDIMGNVLLKVNSNFTNGIWKTILVGGNFLMESNESGTASFVNYGSIDILGSIEVQSYLEADRWHNISSPLTFDTAGVFMDMYLYSFDEATYNPNSNTPTGWSNIVDESVQLGVGVGYKVWSFSSMLGSEKISFTNGSLNDGIKNLPVFATDQDIDGDIGDGEGWNFVGNPYPSGISWDHTSWTKQNIGSSVYVFDGVQYLVWSGSGGFGTLTNGVIPAMQSFFVKASNFNPSLIVSNNSRIHGSSSYKESSIDNLLVLSVDGDGYNDKAFINFNENASNDFDDKYDAYKISGILEAPQLFSYANSNNLAINVLPKLVSDTMVSLGFEVGNLTEYVLTANMLESFNPDIDIYLEDKLLNKIVNLRHQNVYRFSASPVDEPDRFLVHFGVPNNFEEDDLNSNRNIVIYSNENKIYLRNKLDIGIRARFLLYNISGSKIMEEELMIDDIECISTSIISGFYIVKLISHSGINTEKVFIN